MEVPSWLRWSFATAGVGFLGYCVYFDYKRRNDKEFRRAIRQSYIDEARHLEQEAVRQLQEALGREPPEDPMERGRYFQQELMLGTTALKEGPASYPTAAACFYNAVRACPQQHLQQLLGELQSELPEEVFGDIMTLLKQRTFGASMGRGGMGMGMGMGMPMGASQGAQIAEVE